jgi:hypothetical protein
MVCSFVRQEQEAVISQDMKAFLKREGEEGGRGGEGEASGS